jgi:hypothetical protein
MFACAVRVFDRGGGLPEPGSIGGQGVNEAVEDVAEFGCQSE